MSFGKRFCYAQIELLNGNLNVFIRHLLFRVDQFLARSVINDDTVDMLRFGFVFLVWFEFYFCVRCECVRCNGRYSVSIAKFVN